MKERRATPPAHGDGATPGGARVHRDGVVLRDVVVRHEPRSLPRPANRAARLATGGDASHRSNGGGAGPWASGDREDAASAQAEASAHYELGLRAGRAEAEAAHRAASADGIERRRREGFERGLEEGHLEGLARGREEGRHEVDREAAAARDRAAERLAQLDRLLAALPVELASRLDAAEEDMVALSHDVVCRILGEHLVTRDGVAGLVRGALRDAFGGSTPHARGRETTTIHLHPGDLRLLQEDGQVAASLRQDGAGGAVEWVADDRVRLGGCIVTSSEGSLDARLENQLAALQAVLLRFRAAGSPAASTAGVASAPPTPRGPPAPEREG